MEEGNEQFEKFAKFLYTAFFISLGVGALVLWSYDIISKSISEERAYGQKVMPVCEKVMRKFDENKNGIVEDKEGIMLAKALGCLDYITYPEFIPRSGVKYKLLPGHVRGYPPGFPTRGDHIENSIFLIADGPNYWTRTDILPLSKLEELANK
jgi:hypothetical protein